MRTLVILSASFAMSLSGCIPIVYRGYTCYEGTVVDSRSGQPLSRVVVTACMLDRFPGAHMNSCESAKWKKHSVTEADGRFVVKGSRHFGVILPAPHMGPGPYDTNLRFELDGYESTELHWWRDRQTLSGQPLVVRLERTHES